MELREFINTEFLENNIAFEDDNGCNYIDDSYLDVLCCIEKAVKKFNISDVSVPKETLLFHLKALTKRIEDSHCYGFEDVLEDYIKSNAL